MKILIVDDNSERLRIFINALGNYLPSVVDNSEEAVELLETEVYDLILLDDDLEDGGSGADVANHLSENYENPNIEANIILHGEDRRAAEAMLYKLAPVCSSQVEWIPFGLKLFDYLGLTFKKEWL